MHNKQASCQQGFTLIEAMIVIAIVAIVLSLAAPSFNDFFEKNRLKRAAEEVFGLVTKARSEAVIRSADMRIDVDAVDWCVGYEVSPSAPDPDCNCATPNCTVDVAGTDVTQVVDSANFIGVTITETFNGDGTTFDSVKGTAGTGRVSLSSSSGDWDLDVVVSGAGRVILCAPDTSKTTMGYSECPN